MNKRTPPVNGKPACFGTGIVGNKPKLCAVRVVFGSKGGAISVQELAYRPAIVMDSTDHNGIETVSLDRVGQEYRAQMGHSVLRHGSK